MEKLAGIAKPTTTARIKITTNLLIGITHSHLNEFFNPLQAVGDPFPRPKFKYLTNGLESRKSITPIPVGLILRIIETSCFFHVLKQPNHTGPRFLS